MSLLDTPQSEEKIHFKKLLHKNCIIDMEHDTCIYTVNARVLQLTCMPYSSSVLPKCTCLRSITRLFVLVLFFKRRKKLFYIRDWWRVRLNTMDMHAMKSFFLLAIEFDCKMQKEGLSHRVSRRGSRVC